MEILDQESTIKLLSVLARYPFACSFIEEFYIDALIDQGLFSFDTGVTAAGLNCLDAQANQFFEIH